MPERGDIADVLVIGAGASGGAFSFSLAQAGIGVVCLEQGGWVPADAFPSTETDSQLRWQTDFHPDPNTRRLPEDYPVNDSETPIPLVMYNAVGGSTVHWGSHFPRLHPSDFRVKTIDGVADDWPLSYEELEPFYDLNDQMTGVSGLRGDPAYPAKPERPCPPLSVHPSGRLLAGAFDRLGWHWWSSDTAVSTVPYHGREPDTGGFLRSLASTDLTYWPHAIKLGARLETHARVREITVDPDGRATGALYYDSNRVLREQKARVVVLACNGVGTARLLLNSTSAGFPNGLANTSGLVGKNLMHHPVAAVMGIFDELVAQGEEAPRCSAMLSQEFSESDHTRGFFRGYQLQVLAPGNNPLPTALGGPASQRIEWGEKHHREFGERFGRSLGMIIMPEDLPEEHNRVSLDPELTDSDGIPAPKVQYTISENTAKIIDHGITSATKVMEAAGAKRVLSTRLQPLTGGHLLGTARMGEDPARSVVDRWGRAHDVPNLFVIDGSVFTTAGCVNPTATIQALALRTADYLTRRGLDALK